MQKLFEWQSSIYIYFCQMCLKRLWSSKKSLLKTRALIIITSRFELKACFAQFIWATLEMQEVIRAVIWQSNAMQGAVIKTNFGACTLGKLCTVTVSYDVLDQKSFLLALKSSSRTSLIEFPEKFSNERSLADKWLTQSNKKIPGQDFFSLERALPPSILLTIRHWWSQGNVFILDFH